MIELEVHPSRTYFTGKEKHLKVMFEVLRVKTKGRNNWWKVKSQLRFLMPKIKKLPLEEQKAERKKLIEETNYVKFYNRRSDSFASGLLKMVKKHLKKNHIKYHVTDYRKPIETSGDKFVKIKFLDKVEHREEQVRAVKRALDKGRGILACATNAGKTDIAAAIIYEFWAQTKRKPRVLFIVHRTGIVQQSMQRFQKHLDSKLFPVRMIGAGHKKIPSKGILCATTQTGARLAENKNFKFMEFIRECDILFFDEFHINKAKQANKVTENCAAPMRFGLSGTIAEENKLKMMAYEGMTGPVIARISNKELVDGGRSARPHFRLMEMNTDKMGEMPYRTAFEKGIVEHRERNRAVIKETLRYAEKNLPTLIMVNRLKHGLLLKKKLEQKVDIPIEFIQGSTPLDIRRKVIKKFERGHSILITSPIFDVGQDAPGIGAAVLAGGGQGWELVLQRLGRLLRRKKGENKVYITDFIDMHQKHLFRHSLARFNHYRRENIGTFSFKEIK